ncbi:MAG: HEAT repeat domain-containing protein [Deltaproteobacteria bacterium]|nr:HEAT repeat domain-containing protein [Deltaproteobacteria bacterium]
MPKLIEARKDKDGHVRVAAVVALGKLADAGADPDEADRIVSALFSGSLIWSPNMVPAICDSLFLIAQTMGPQEVQNSIVPQLDKDLRRNESWLVRRAAARTLGRLGDAAAPAVPALVKALKDEEWWVRQDAAWALGRIGPSAVAAVDSLISALREWPAERRPLVIEALDRIGTEALRPLADIAGNKSESWWVRAAAMEILGGYEPQEIRVIRAAIISLKEERHPQLIGAAEKALLNWGGEALPVMVSALNSPDWKFCERLMALISTMVKKSPEMIDPVLVGAQNVEQQIRQYSARLLGELGNTAAIGELGNTAAIRRLIALLSKKDEAPEVRKEAAGALGKLKAAEAVPYLIAALKADSVERDALADALVSIGPSCVPDIIPLLKDPRTEKDAEKILTAMGPGAAPELAEEMASLSRRGVDGEQKTAAERIAKILIQLGPGAIPPLVLFLNHPDEEARGRIKKTLVAMGPRAVPVVVSMLESDDPSLVRAVVELIGEFGVHAEPAVPKLISLLTDPARSDLRDAVAKTIVKIGFPAAAPLIVKFEALDPKSEAPEVMSAIEKILVEMKDFSFPLLIPKLGNDRIDKIAAQMGEPVVKGLIAMLADPDPEVVWSAIKVLVEIGEPALDDLSIALESENKQVREASAVALGEMGPVAEPMREALEKRLALEEDLEVAAAIRESLNKLKADE